MQLSQVVQFKGWIMLSMDSESSLESRPLSNQYPCVGRVSKVLTLYDV